MKCEKCSGELLVDHTYDAGAKAKTARLTCMMCGAVHVTITKIVSVDPVWGQGASAIAERMKKGLPEGPAAPRGQSEG